MNDKSSEELIIERYETVNKFIDLPENYDDGVLKAVGDFLDSDIYRMFNRKHVFPDPNGEFSILLTNKDTQANITIRGDNDIECIFSNSKESLFSGTVSELKEVLEESLN